MKHRKLSILTTGLAVALMSGGLAIAQPAGGDGEKDRPKRERKERAEGEQGKRHGQHLIRALYKDIELSDDQKGQVREVVGNLKEEHEAHRAKVRAARENLREARKSGDEAAIAEAREALKELITNPPILAALPDFRGVLSDSGDQAQFDQNVENVKAKIKEHAEGRKERRGERRENRDGDGDGERPQRKRDRDGDAGGEGGSLDI